MGDAYKTKKPKLKLYLSFPQKIVTQEQVKQLHPGGILGVFLPRQKRCFWSTATFKAADVTLEAKLKLKKTKIGKKRLIVTPLRPWVQASNSKVVHKKEEKV